MARTSSLKSYETSNSGKMLEMSVSSSVTPPINSESQILGSLVYVGLLPRNTEGRLSQLAKKELLFARFGHLKLFVSFFSFSFYLIISLPSSTLPQCLLSRRLQTVHSSYLIIVLCSLFVIHYSLIVLYTLRIFNRQLIYLFNQYLLCIKLTVY